MSKTYVTQGRRLAFTAPGQIEFLPFDVPAPKADEVVIETHYSAISPGTERAILNAEANTITRAKGFPFYPGYSTVGRIVAAGESVTDFAIGQFVATMQTHASHCVLPGTFGATLPPASFQAMGYFTGAPPTFRHLVWPLSGEMTKERLRATALFKFANVAIAGVRRSRLELGEPVVVIGLGPIGLCAAREAVLAGGFPVYGIDPVPARREIALRFGVSAVFKDIAAFRARDRSLARTEPKVVIEASGNPAVVPEVFKLGARGGRIVLLGAPRGVVPGINFYELQTTSSTIIAISEPVRPPIDSSPGNWTAFEDADLVLRLMQAGRIDLAPLITHEFRPEDAPKAYETAQSDRAALGIVLNWGRSSDV